MIVSLRLVSEKKSWKEFNLFNLNVFSVKTNLDIFFVIVPDEVVIPELLFRRCLELAPSLEILKWKNNFFVKTKTILFLVLHILLYYLRSFCSSQFGELVRDLLEGLSLLPEKDYISLIWRKRLFFSWKQISFFF